jgi:hypothetical protein
MISKEELFKSGYSTINFLSKVIQQFKNNQQWFHPNKPYAKQG